MDLVPTNVGSAPSRPIRPIPCGVAHGDFLLSPEDKGVLEKFYYGSGAKELGQTVASEHV